MVDITNEHTYLGLKMTPNAKFSVANQHLSEKATHALYKMRKNLDFHSLPPDIACKIFDTIISPILLYNSEIWGAYFDNDYLNWDKTTIEKTHLNFVNYILRREQKSQQPCE